MLLAELSIWPMDKGESVSPYVARCVEVIERSGLAYQLGPLGTTIEGEWREVMEVVNRCYDALAPDCNRIAATLKMDWRRGRQGGIEQKVQSVRDKMRRQA
jgi:uncharacterized protein (TIGR00106 family)